MNAVGLLHPVMLEALEIFRQYHPGSVTSTYRSIAEQARLRREFERGRARFPAERPGTSTHHTGLAFDYVVSSGLDSPLGRHSQEVAGKFWRDYLGGRWSTKDIVHFEHPEARAAVQAGLTRIRWWL